MYQKKKTKQNEEKMKMKKEASTKQSTAIGNTNRRSNGEKGSCINH